MGPQRQTAPAKRVSRRSRRLTAGALLGMALCAALALPGAMNAGCGSSGLEEVQLDSGPVSGVLEEVGEEEVWTFKGIPYAAPPVGALRWKPPQPVTPWTEPLECTTFGPSCPQPGQGESLYGDVLTVGPTAEDCLYLNVWSPARSPDERLPVMVWIHGGSFETGSGSMAVYSGENLATRGVVLVTINYRLGPFGFLAHPALSAESVNGVSGNYGLLDQIAALKWVRTNIAGFGGDPDNVTIFGESAGAISVLELLVSPQAEGLFQRAIAQSGILLDEGFGVSTTGTLEEGEARGEDFVKRLGVDESGDVLTQMRSKTADELLNAMEALAAESGLLEQGLTWKPVADGYVLPDLPSRLWAAGKRQSVPLLIGSNADEGNIFLAGLAVSPEDYETQMRRIFKEHADEALALYPVTEGDDPAKVVGRMLTEIGFASTARFAARSMSADRPLADESLSADAAGAAPKAAPAYLYQFTRAPLGETLGAFHGIEIPYVFGTLDLFAALGAAQQVDHDLSAAMMGYWTRFATTGGPNGEGAPEWPRYDAASDQHLELGDTIRTGAGLYREACDLADRIRGLE